MGGRRHEAPIRSNTDNGQQWSGDMDAMHRLFDGTNPDRVSKAGPVYSSIATKLTESVGVLRSQASALAGVWKGDDADATIKQMQRLYNSGESIRQVAYQTGKVLSDHGEKLKWYKDRQPREGFFKGLTWDQAGVVTGGTLLGGPTGGLIGLDKGEALGLIRHTESKAAVEHVQRLSGRARQANSAMPDRMSVEFPEMNVWGGRPPTGPGGGIPGGGGGLPGGGGGGGGSLPGGGGSMPGGFDGAGNSGDGTMHGGGFGGGIPGGGSPGSDLAGLPDGGGGAGADPFGRSGLGGGGSLPGGGGGGGSLPGGGGGLPGGMAGTGTGAGKGSGLGGAKGLGKGGGAAGRGGMGGAPMGGGRGGGGKGEEEHERSTWLREDEDVWGGNDDDASPPVIG